MTYSSEVIVGYGGTTIDVPLLISPNPVESGSVSLTLPKSKSANAGNTGTIRIYDNEGRLVQQEPAQGHKNLLDVDDLPSGLYRVQVILGGTIATGNMVIVR